MIGRAQVSKKFSLFSSNEDKEAGYFHFGPIWTPLDHFKQKLIFCSRAPPPKPYFFHLGQNINFCLIWSKRSINFKFGMEPSFAQRNAHAEDWGRNPPQKILVQLYPQARIHGVVEKAHVTDADTSELNISTPCLKTNLTTIFSHNSDKFLLYNILYRLHIHPQINLNYYFLCIASLSVPDQYFCTRHCDLNMSARATQNSNNFSAKLFHFLYL